LSGTAVLVFLIARDLLSDIEMSFDA
jgi:hypothetical protein